MSCYEGPAVGVSVVCVLVPDREARHLDWCSGPISQPYVYGIPKLSGLLAYHTSCPQVVRVLAPDLLARLQEELQVRRPSAALNCGGSS